MKAAAPGSGARPRPAALVVVVLVGVALGIASVVMTAGPASARGDRAGDVVIADRSGEPISSGATDTVFGLTLPSGAACQGDSASGNYRVSTFLVPQTDDPGSLEYGELRPFGDGRWSIWKESTDPGLNMATSVSEAGEPGLLTGLPAFTFDVGLFPGEIASGAYRLGLACTLGGQTTRYWDTSVVIAEGDADRPISWSASDAAVAPSSSRSTSVPAAAVGVVVVVVVVVVVFVATRRRRQEHHSLPVSEEEK